MKIRTRKQLLEAYANPLEFVSPEKRKRLFAIYALIAILIVLLGTVLILIGITGDGTGAQPNRRPLHTFPAGIFIVVMPMYGIYRLFTIRRSAIKHLKNKLVDKKLPIDLG